jgi:hypothetical protein
MVHTIFTSLRRRPGVCTRFVNEPPRGRRVKVLLRPGDGSAQRSAARPPERRPVAHQPHRRRRGGWLVNHAQREPKRPTHRSPSCATLSLPPLPAGPRGSATRPRRRTCGIRIREANPRGGAGPALGVLPALRHRPDGVKTLRTQGPGAMLGPRNHRCAPTQGLRPTAPGTTRLLPPPVRSLPPLGSCHGFGYMPSGGTW